MTGFLDQWKDTASVQRLRKSDKSKDVQKVEVENHLKSMAFRFERSPQASNLSFWAQDIVDAGYEDWMVKEICKSIPYKFERYPTLSQIMELLRPYLPQLNAIEDELDKYTRLAIPHLKAKFVSLIGEDVFNRMILYYSSEIKSCSIMPEVALLGDWCRSYMASDPKKIIEQGKLSDEEAAKGNKEYFVKPLKLYAESNKLV